MLHERLSRVLGEERLVRLDQPITCADSEPEPDISVVAGTNRDFRRDHPHTAEFVVEICVTSHDYDRSKLRAYAMAGVKECWLVLGPEKQIEVYWQPQDGSFSRRETFGIDQSVTSVAIPEFTVNLRETFEE